MHRFFLLSGAVLSGLGVILGAFGAHKLKEIAPDSVPTFQTGVQYQMYHAIALIFIAILLEKYPVKFMTWAGAAFLMGIILFSGSLYALAALKATGKVGLGGVGILTPIGGLFFIAGWVFFVLSVLNSK
ncbi:DUF423 domain-containing protein [Niabella drilacis]|uniref:Uncharacterized membrane protein YgdD, TMEM256/DUF423 family n=1 Tax=Niabella drilacis (strain DSM 25811 / CCM 8410 / CCUG 62505 / LMG 26954 / E90) TaxID=1285928 RepID=A0A1G6L542_NIADE|nr:DUF423 domain-containing protein [Niabella drilacis]SDC38248.1 Uncharacterized membrane protein YgdD, TMEM256/DUF423 family [Niabella drilacis]